MKRTGYIFSLLLLLVFSLRSNAQYAFSTFPPPTVFGLEDLWHFSLSGPSGGTYDQFYVVMQVYDVQQQLLVNGTSGVFTLGNGHVYINKLGLSAIQPINTQYTGNGTFNSLVGNGGLFPAGTYYIRYTLMGRNAVSQQVEQVDQQQISQTVELLFPPTLLTPFDNDSIEEYYPVFTWTPAFSGSGERIFYDIVVAEELPGQTAEQAINSNPYYFREENLTSSSIQYPVSARQLQANQWYAWRVTAYVNGQPMARSESWRFIIVEPENTPCEPKPAKVYYELQPQVSGSYALVNSGQLDFFFREQYEVTRDQLQFSILNAANKEVAGSKNITKLYETGVNRYSLMLNQHEITLSKGFYTLVVYGEKNAQWKLRFEVTNDIVPCE